MPQGRGLMRPLSLDALSTPPLQVAERSTEVVETRGRRPMPPGNVVVAFAFRDLALQDQVDRERALLVM